MGQAYSTKTIWRYNYYSIGAGLAGAAWYIFRTEDKDWKQKATVVFFAGVGIGGTVAWAQNSFQK